VFRSWVWGVGSRAQGSDSRFWKKSEQPVGDQEEKFTDGHAKREKQWRNQICSRHNDPHSPLEYSHLERLNLMVQFSISEQMLSRNVERFREGLVFQAQRLLRHSSLGSRVIKKKRRLNSIKMN